LIDGSPQKTHEKNDVTNSPVTNTEAQVTFRLRWWFLAIMLLLNVTFREIVPNQNTCFKKRS
jgi:hypothetical protein